MSLGPLPEASIQVLESIAQADKVKGDVDDGVDGVEECGGQSVGRRHVIGDTADGTQLR